MKWLFILLAALQPLIALAQDCDPHTQLDKQNAAMLTAASKIDIEWKPSDCQIKPDPGNVQIEGSVPETQYQLSGNICYDTRCFAVDPKIDVHLKETIQESMSCIKNLTSEKLQRLVEKKIRGKDLASDEIEQIRQSVPARTALQLQAINRLDSRFADVFNENGQNWAAVIPPVMRVTNADKAFIKNSLQDPSPLRISCFPLGTKFSYSRKLGKVFITEPIEVLPTFGTAAEASSPGMPLWPSINLHPVGYSMKSGSPPAIKSILLHEMMHLLGYNHRDLQSAEPETHATLPLFSACQVCCFPEGLKERQRIRPVCNTKGKGSLQAMACSLCAGEKTVPEFRKIEQSYEEMMGQCYIIGNSL